MWENLSEINSLLSQKKYNDATSIVKSRIDLCRDEFTKKELIKVLKKELLFSNLSGDSNRTNLFCNKIMNYSLEKGIDLVDYIEQCRVLNAELDWYSEQYHSIIRELFSLDNITALHVILSIFENFNQRILSKVPSEEEQIFYFSYVLGMESNYESGIYSLNKLLELWNKSKISGKFQGRFKQLTHIDNDFKELKNKLGPIIGSLNYLEWLCKEISLYQVSMDTKEHEIILTVNDYEQYRHYKLPFVRETARMQSALISSIMKEEIQQNKEISYKKIVEVKHCREDFRLKIDQESFIEAFRQSHQEAYKTYKLMIEEIYITDMKDIKIKNSSLSMLDLFWFYYCLNTLAILYFNATQYFIYTEKKGAKAPYLAISKNYLGELFIPLLSRLLNRRVNQKEIDDLVDLFKFGERNINDLYYKPLIVNGNQIIILPSIFRMNNFHKTFMNHMKILDVNLTERGECFEMAIQSLLLKHNFKVNEGKYPFSYRYEEKTFNGDIDLIAQKENYLFIGQLKNRLEPMDPQDYRGADKKIKKGIIQAKLSELYIKRNPEEFCERFGISIEQLENLTIYPFVLVSCFYGSGQIIDGVPIIDDSALFKFLNDGEIKIYPGKGEPFSKLIRTPGDVLVKEFLAFLKRPYFLDKDIYDMQISTNHIFYIRNKKIIFGTAEDANEKFQNSFLKEALVEFEKRN